MSSVTKHPTKTIWLIEHSSDNIWLLELILENWGYDTVRMSDSEALEPKSDSRLTQPSLIILSVAPQQNNVLSLVRNFSHHSTWQYVPLLCLCPSGGLCKSQVMAAGASDVLNKPFELEELHYNLQRLWRDETSTQYSVSQHEMTLFISETESSNLIEQQHYWSNIFQHYPQFIAWKMLTKEGYEVFE